MPAVLLATALAMVAFAANSLLARLALAETGIDAASYTIIRLGSGAAALMVLLAMRPGRQAGPAALPGNTVSALALFVYAIAFSLAYLRLGAATGALVLFACVQATMIGWGVARGERPTPRELIGLTVAFAAFVWLVLPGLGAPDPLGSLLMAAAGVAWGVYSLRGRGVRDALADTAGNFVRSLLPCLLVVPLAVVWGRVEPAGAWLAVASGALASGLGYAVWYRALPGLTATQAGLVQLTVPAIAAGGAILFLSEPLTLRFVVAGVMILGGVAFAIQARSRPAGGR